MVEADHRPAVTAVPSPVPSPRYDVDALVIRLAEAIAAQADVIREQNATISAQADRIDELTRK